MRSPRLLGSAILVGSGLLTLLMLGAGTISAAKPSPQRAISVEWRRDVWLPPEIRTMDVNGGNKLTVAKDLWRGGAPRWSPDGLRLGGYQKQIGTGPLDFAIVDVRANGADERPLLTGPEFDGFNIARGLKPVHGLFSGSPFGLAAYGPGGSSMVFSGLVRYEGPTAEANGYDDRYQYRLFRITLDGAKTITPVTDEDAAYDDFDPHWSWTLNKIVFVRSQTTLPASWRGRPARTGQAQLWAVNPDGTNLQQLTNFSTASLPSGTGSQLATPVWSRNATRIVLVGGLEGGLSYSGDLWLLAYNPEVSATTATVVRAQQGAWEGEPAWSPDDAKLIFLVQSKANDRQDRFQITIRTLADGSERMIVDQNNQAVLNPDWNPVVPVPAP